MDSINETVGQAVKSALTGDFYTADGLLCELIDDVPENVDPNDRYYEVIDEFNKRICESMLSDLGIEVDLDSEALNKIGIAVFNNALGEEATIDSSKTTSLLRDTCAVIAAVINCMKKN